MGFKFECHCDWCGTIAVLEANQPVIDLSESIPSGWSQISDAELGEKTTLCIFCSAARQDALKDAAQTRIDLLSAAKERRMEMRARPDRELRERERRQAAEGY